MWFYRTYLILLPPAGELRFMNVVLPDLFDSPASGRGTSFYKRFYRTYLVPLPPAGELRFMNVVLLDLFFLPPEADFFSKKRKKFPSQREGQGWVLKLFCFIIQPLKTSPYGFPLL
jgi:hypothetical protein